MLITKWNSHNDLPGERSIFHDNSLSHQEVQRMFPDPLSTKIVFHCKSMLAGMNGPQFRNENSTNKRNKMLWVFLEGLSMKSELHKLRDVL